MDGSGVEFVDLQAPPSVVAAAIDDACRRVGFFAVTGHGVAEPLVAAMTASAAAFFALPLETKLRSCHSHPGHPYGYFPLRSEALARSTGGAGMPDLKESFNLAPPIDHRDDTGRFGGVARIWPDLAGFEPTWTAYYDNMVELADRLLGHMARALGVDPMVFHSRTRRHMSALRAVSYPPVTLPVREGQLRAGAHTDYGTLTILLPGAGSGGLEILAPDGAWVPVAPRRGAFIVNLGDLMERWTDGHWRSTLHRVALPASAAAATEWRQSIAFFHQPDWDAQIASLTGDHLYPPIRYGDWLATKFAASTGTESS